MGRGFEPHGAHVISLSQIHRTRDYLTHEKLWIQSLRHSNVEYRNGYFLYKDGRWRGFDWIDVRHETLDHKVLIIGHCDNDVTLDIATEILHSAKPDKIYATNLTTEASALPQMSDLPLGIPNDERQSKTHIIQADHTLLQKAWKRGKSPSRFDGSRLYANFSIRNNVKVRQATLDAVKEVPGNRIGSFVLSKRGRLADLRAMRESGLVLCPRGAGMDTHRFWECLLVGAIPVVLKSDHSSRLAQKWKLPVIVVDNWLDLRDKKNIEDQWDSIHDTSWDFSPLTFSYWKHKIFTTN